MAHFQYPLISIASFPFLRFCTSFDGRSEVFSQCDCGVSDIVSSMVISECNDHAETKSEEDVFPETSLGDLLTKDSYDRVDRHTGANATNSTARRSTNFTARFSPTGSRGPVSTASSLMNGEAPMISLKVIRGPTRPRITLIAMISNRGSWVTSPITAYGRSTTFE